MNVCCHQSFLSEGQPYDKLWSLFLSRLPWAFSCFIPCVETIYWVCKFTTFSSYHPSSFLTFFSPATQVFVLSFQCFVIRYGIVSNISHLHPVNRCESHRGCRSESHRLYRCESHRFWSCGWMSFEWWEMRWQCCLQWVFSGFFRA